MKVPFLQVPFFTFILHRKVNKSLAVNFKVNIEIILYSISEQKTYIYKDRRQLGLTAAHKQKQNNLLLPRKLRE